MFRPSIPLKRERESKIAQVETKFPPVCRELQISNVDTHKNIEIPESSFSPSKRSVLPQERKYFYNDVSNRVSRK